MAAIFEANESNVFYAVTFIPLYCIVQFFFPCSPSIMFAQFIYRMSLWFFI